MAEGPKVAGHNPDSSEDNATDLHKCEKSLQEMNISSRNRKPWRLGFSSRRKDPISTQQKSISRLHGVNNCSMLITAITTGDLDKCLQLLDLVSQRELNKLFRVSVRAGNFKVTPLLWAVIHSRTAIVKLMINKGANVNRQGYLENEHITHTYTPLMRALDNRDREIVEMLLAACADPYLRVSGPRLSEEEGGSVRYTTWLYPVGKAVATDDLGIIQTFMQRYDPTTYNTDKYHMCLCLTLCKRKLSNWYEIVRCIISYGGKVCSGLVVDNPRDYGMCYYFKLLIRGSFSFIYSNNDAKLQCNFPKFKILSIICKTDYLKPSSSIAKALKQYFNIFEKAKFQSPDNFTCKRSFECFQEMLNFCERPSRLKQICCVTIRDNIRRLSPEKCSQLPLPPVLQRYVAFLDEN